MSLEYSLALAGDLAAERVCELLAQGGELTAHGGQLQAPELTISIADPSALSRQIIEEAFAFTPALELTFRLDKFKDREQALRRILSSVGELLRTLSVDLSLLFNGEAVVLTRIAGRLELNGIPGFWGPDRLGLMPEPFQQVPARTI